MNDNKGAGLVRYRTVRDGILTDIRERKLRANEQIPTEIELMEQYGVSRTTVRRAIQDLVDTGALVKYQGVGTFVNAPKYTRNVLRCISFTSDCINHGYTPSTETMSFEHTKADEESARRLSIEDGGGVYRFCRLRIINGDPVMIEYNEVPDRYSFVADCSADELQSLMRLFRDKIGAEFRRYDSVIEVSYATKQEAEMLKIREGAVVLINECVIRDTEQTPLLSAKQIIAAERVKLDVSAY